MPPGRPGGEFQTSRFVLIWLPDGMQRCEGFSLGKTRAFRNVGWDKLAERATAHHGHALGNLQKVGRRPPKKILHGVGWHARGFAGGRPGIRTDKCAFCDIRECFCLNSEGVPVFLPPDFGKLSRAVCGRQICIRAKDFSQQLNQRLGGGAN